MAKNDWAIVVGIQAYPEMPPLEGPDNDAQDFYDWLIDEKGGAVPRHQANLIITPKKKVPFKKTEKAIPAYQQIESAAFRMVQLADKKPLKDNHRYIGRRLYLYYAGHGFAPREEQTALIMANATKMRIGAGYHWLGQRTADWFWQSGYFDEIVLLMDCCRNYMAVPELSWPWPPQGAPDFQARVKRFYAFATGWTLEARGERDGNGQVHGIFTQALLAGLRKYGNAPSTDVVTTDSLSAYIRSRIPLLQPSDFRTDSFDLVKIAEPADAGGTPVKIIVPPQAVGKAIEVITYLNGAPSVVYSDPAAQPVWVVNLQKGYYQAQVPELGLTTQPFAVTNSEVPDVRFS
jgi:hypothetical protein